MEQLKGWVQGIAQALKIKLIDSLSATGTKYLLSPKVGIR